MILLLGMRPHRSPRTSSKPILVFMCSSKSLFSTAGLDFFSDSVWSAALLWDVNGQAPGWTGGQSQSPNRPPGVAFRGQMGQESPGEDAYLLLLVYLSWVMQSAYTLLHHILLSSLWKKFSHKLPLPHEQDKDHEAWSSFTSSWQSLDSEPHLTWEYVMQPTTKYMSCQYPET